MAPGIFLSLAPFVLSTTDRDYRTFGLELKHFLRPRTEAIVLLESCIDQRSEPDILEVRREAGLFPRIDRVEISRA